MLFRSPAALLLILLAACHSAPAPVAEDPHPEVQDSLAALRQQMQMLQHRVRNFTDEALRPQPEDAATMEVAARLAMLNQRLDHVIARLPAPGPTTGAADAAAQRTALALAANAADTACITALQRAIAVVQRQRELITENLANLHVGGYRRRTLELATELDSDSGLYLPKAGTVALQMTFGALNFTERRLDVAIDGEGWFVVTGTDGEPCYSRAGNLRLNAAQQLVTPAGYPLSPIIIVPEDTLEIVFAPTGRVTGRRASQADDIVEFGHVELARWVNPTALEPTNGGLFRAKPAAGAPIHGRPGTLGLGLLRQGALEGSNVQVVNELVSLQVVDRHLTVLRRALASYGVFVH